MKPIRNRSDICGLIIQEIGICNPNISAEDISLDKGFLEMGIESLQAVSIIDGLAQKLNIPLDITALFDQPNINALANYIFEVLSVQTATLNLNASLSKYDDRSPEKYKLGRSHDPLSIIGMSCRFPGSESLEKYYELLRNGTCAVKMQTHERWQSEKGDSINYFGGLSNYDRFAADVFGISDREAQAMDPQQRLLLEEVWRALEDSGIPPTSIRGSNTGVFIGISSHDYSYKIDSLEQKNIFSITGNSQSIAANRISYFYDLTGPSLTIDTACSSSLVALDSAVKALQNNEIEMAIVGGVNLILKAELSQAFKAATMLSPDGLCKTFSADANGYVRGEGVGVVVLKRKSTALSSNHRVYADVLSVAINQDGRSSSLTAPNGSAQETVIQEAIRRAGISNNDILFHEAHGTGTAVGDPIEALALERVHWDRDLQSPLLVSSAKTNIGHLEAAAGIAGLIKVALQIHHKILFPSLHFNKINPLLENRIPHLKILTELCTMPAERKRIGSISSFGFGGTNSHAILAQNHDVIHCPTATTPSPTAFYFGGFSSNDRSSLIDSIRVLRNFITPLSIENIQKTLNSTLHQRLSLNEQVLFYASSKENLLEILNHIIDDKVHPQYYFSQKPKANLKAALIFTGQGSQYTGMYHDLYKSIEIFKSSVDKILFQAQKYFPINLFHVWLKPELENELNQTNYSQILIFSFEYSLARLLTNTYQLKVDSLFGHSLGELVAATIAGSINLDEAIELVCRRGHFMKSSLTGGMLAVFTTLENIQNIFKSADITLDLAANNGPDLQVISGALGEIEKAQRVLEEKKIRCQRLPVKHAFHSSLMDFILEPFGESIASIKYNNMDTTLVSSVTGLPLEEQLSSKYWMNQLRSPTQFEKAMKYLHAGGTQVFIEIGPKPVLSGMAQKFIDGKKINWVSFIDSRQKNQDSLAIGFLKLIQLGLLKTDLFICSNKDIDVPKTILKKTKYWLSGGAMEKKQTINREIILSKLVDILATTMRIAPDDVSVDEPLVDLGADSLVLLNAVQIIKDSFQVAIPISDVFKNLNTLRKIADYISEQHKTELPEVSSETRAPANSIHQTTPTTSFMHVTNLTNSSILGSTSVNGDVISLLNNQLLLMQNQIQLINNSSQSVTPSVNLPATSKLAPTTTVLEGLEKEKRGVLGNFRSFATTEKSDESNQIKKEFLQKTISSVVQMTTKTKNHVQKYRKNLADNRVSAGFRPNTKEMIYPIHCYKAKGSQFIDMDGNTFIDFTMGFGVNLFGHSPEFLDQALKEQFELGLCVGPQSHLAGLVAELFCEITGHERVSFLNSGTEAVMTAIRLARAAHKKNKIVIFDGSYHGHFDGVLAKGTKNITSMPVAAGITQNMVNDIIVLEYGNPKSLEVIRTQSSELAAVLVEPVQSRFPELQPQDFLKELRKITQENNIAFIWDEVITGFRISPGGAQEYFGIKADLASYGKVLGGGMPIGAVGGSSRYLDFIDGGFWEFGNDSFPENEMTFFAGTFSKHPLAMATSLATLKKIKSEGKEIIKTLNLKTDDLVKKLNRVFEELSLDIKSVHFGTLFRFKGSLNLDLLFAKLLEKGFYIWEGRNCFLSTAHTNNDLQQFVEAVKQSCRELQLAKFYPSTDKSTANVTKVSESRSPQNLLDLTHSQRRFLKIQKLGQAAVSANTICVSAKVKGVLDVSKLQQTIEYISQRRDVFKWNFSLSTEKQFFQETTKPIDFEFINLRSIERPWKILDKHLNDFSKTEFDLSTGSPMQIKVFDVVEETHLMAVIVHHLAFDGWSMTLFFEDLANVYNSLLKGVEPTLRPAYSFEQLLKQPQEIPAQIEEILTHKYLGTKPSKLFDLGDSQAYKYEAQRIVFDIELKVFEALKRWCKQNKITPFMLLFAAFAKTLMDEFKKERLTIGIPAANRDIPGTEIMYGNCANLVPITLESKAEPILSFARQVKETIIEGYQTMNYPYELLKEKTGDLFDVYFNLEPTSDLPKFDDASLLIHPFVISAAEFPLMLNITDFEHYYHCEMDFQKSQITDDRVLKIIDKLRKNLREELVTKVSPQSQNQSSND